VVQQAAVVVIVFALANTLYGYPPPFDLSSPTAALTSGALFVAYIYFARTLFRLPFALVVGWRRYRRARQVYEHDRRAALIDGFYRGFASTRRWESGQLAVIDRLVFFTIVWFACNPARGPLYVQLGGVLGLTLLVTLYLVRGSFAGLVEDGTTTTRGPFNLPNLRR